MLMMYYFFSRTHKHLSHTITLINKFPSVSDYSINWSKTTVLPINYTFQNIPNITLQSGNIKYLGINISPSVSELIKLNYVQLLKIVEDDLTRWKSLPISLMGRVATIKMMILPRINYLFSMIPTKPPSTWFKTLDSLINKFLWKAKPPRISLKTLQKSKNNGGLDLPNFHLYFLANRLQYITKWLNPNQLDEPWLDVEQVLCNDLVISSLPFISPTVRYRKCFKSININSTLTAWWEFLKLTKSSLIPCKFTPIWNNPDILQNKKMINFPQWNNRGIKHLENIIQNRNFIPLEELTAQYKISSTKFLEYQQIKSIISKKYNPNQLDLQLPAQVEEFINLKAPKLLSKIYRLLVKTEDSISLPILKWETDLSSSFDNNFWSQICSNTFKMTRNSNLQLIQYKIIHRIQYTGQRMFKMGLTQSNICPHCTNNIPDDYLHAVWYCTPVQKFWLRVCEDLSGWFKCNIPACPRLCPLGNLDDTVIDSNLKHLVLTALCIAKKTILLNWKSKNNLSCNQYKNLLLDYISNEIMSASSSKQELEEVNSLWSPVISSIT